MLFLDPQDSFAIVQRQASVKPKEEKMGPDDRLIVSSALQRLGRAHQVGC